MQRLSGKRKATRKGHTPERRAIITAGTPATRTGGPPPPGGGGPLNFFPSSSGNKYDLVFEKKHLFRFFFEKKLDFIGALAPIA